MGRNARRRSQARQTSADPSRPTGLTPNEHPWLPPTATETLVHLIVLRQEAGRLH